MSIRNTKTGKTMSQDFNDMLKDFEQFVSEDLPLQIVEAAEELVHDSFDKQQYQDGKSGAWAKRKGKKKKDKGRAILVQTGALRRSTGAERRGENIVIYADEIYAQVHNEGGQIEQAARSETFTRNRTKRGKFKKGTKDGPGFTFKEKIIKMPKRQFMPIPGEENPQLSKKIEKLSDAGMKKIFN